MIRARAVPLGILLVLLVAVSTLVSLSGAGAAGSAQWWWPQPGSARLHAALGRAAPVVGAPSRPPSAASVRAVWTTRGVRPVTGITTAGPTALFYGVVGHQLYLYGLDAATGRVLWRQAASTAEQETGIGIEVRFVLGRVVYFRPAAGQDLSVAQMVFADPRTGRDRAVGSAQRWQRLPDVCPGQPSQLCDTLVLTRADGDGASTRVQIDPATGSWTTLSGDRYRELGAGIVDLLARQPEVLALADKRTLLWTRKLSDVVGPGISSDNGWDFESYADGSVIVGTMNRLPVELGPRHFRRDLSQESVTVALDRATGRVLWRQDGTALHCDSRLIIKAAGADQPIRCRYTGLTDYQGAATGSASTSTVTGLGVTVERFDPRTGKAVWSRDVGAAPLLAAIDDGNAPFLSDTQVAIVAGTARTVLDVRTGAVRPATATDMFWCATNTDFIESPRSDYGQRGPSWRYGFGVSPPCTATGTPIATPGSAVAATVPAAVSARFGVLQLVASPTAVIAYQ